MKRFGTRVVLAALAATAVFAVGASSAGAVPKTFYGVVNQGPLFQEDYRTMGAANVGTLRILVRWDNSVQPARDRCCNWSAYDSLIGQAAEVNVQALPFIVGSPSWAVKKGVPHPPLKKKARRAWQNFLQEFMRRYGRGGTFWNVNPYGGVKPIKTVQIWNEPSSPDYWTKKPKGKQYAKLVKASAKAMRKVDKKADVMLAGLFATPTKKRGRVPIGKYLKDFYRYPRIEKFFKTAAIHPYAAKIRTLKKRMKQFRKAMDRAGDKQGKIQVSELGWASAGPKSPFRKGPKGQAKHLKKSFKLLKRNKRRWSVKGVNWYSWKDIPNIPGVCKWCPYTGLFEQDRTAKPSFAAFNKFTR